MRRVHTFGRKLLLGVLITVAGIDAAKPATAQDATPAAACEAPPLPTGTPTPLEEASPSSSENEASHDHDATPSAAVDEPALNAPPPVGTSADSATADAVEAAVENLVACINNEEYLAAAALMSDNFIQTFIGVPTVYDVPATFEETGPLEVVALANAQSYADGSVSIDFVWSGFYAGPDAVISERWFFIPDDGLLKIDTIVTIPLPDGALPGATVVEVMMVDFAFALSESTLPANHPIVLRVTNSSRTSGHVAVVVSYAEGTTAESVITADGAIEPTGFFAVLYLEPGQTGDVGLVGLAPGTYFLVCDVETESGVPHYELGMASEFTVE